MFLPLHWRRATQSARTWTDYPWPWVSLTWLLLVTGYRRSMYDCGQSEIKALFEPRLNFLKMNLTLKFQHFSFWKCVRHLSFLISIFLFFCLLCFCVQTFVKIWHISGIAFTERSYYRSRPRKNAPKLIIQVTRINQLKMKLLIAAQTTYSGFQA